MPRRTSAIAILFLLAGLITLAWSWRRSSRPQFPEPAMGYRNDVIDFDAPLYPETPSIPVPELNVAEVPEDTVPVELDIWTSGIDEPMVIEGVIIGPEWMRGTQGAFFVQVRWLDSTGRRSGYHTLGQVKPFPWDDEARCDFRFEGESPDDAGQYPIQITALHPRELPNWEPGHTPTPEEVNALMVTTVLAEGLLIVGQE